MTDNSALDDQRPDDPLLSPEEDALLDKVWDNIDFSDTEDDDQEQSALEDDTSE